MKSVKITFEGEQGSGKSTLCLVLRKILEDKGYNVVFADTAQHSLSVLNPLSFLPPHDNEADFQGTELERDVIQAATAWYEEMQEHGEPENCTRPQAALINAVLALGSKQGGF